jgi:hypothetical protein
MQKPPLAPKPKNNWIIQSVEKNTQDDAEQSTWRLILERRKPWTLELYVKENFKENPSSQDHFIALAHQLLQLGLSDKEESLSARTDKSIEQLSAIKSLCEISLPQKLPGKDMSLSPRSPKSPKAPRTRPRAMSEGGPCTFHYDAIEQKNNKPSTPTRAASVPPLFSRKNSFSQNSNEPGSEQPPVTPATSRIHTPVLVLDMGNLSHSARTK